jgi:hypothetical protein
MLTGLTESQTLQLFRFQKLKKKFSDNDLKNQYSRLCGLVVRVVGSRGPGSIPDNTRMSKK